MPAQDNAKAEIRDLQDRVAALRHTVATLIVWMSGSADGSIRRDEAERLLKLLDERGIR